MDDRRFDHITRLFGAGASRRSILKGLLGLGGAVVGGAVVSKTTDARTVGTRPTIPPPPLPKPTTTTTTTPAPCPGQEKCPNSTLCCPTGTCARSGNQGICCDGTNGHGAYVCGLECCESAFHCCDRECCPSNTVCLARQYPGSDEEICCAAESICIGEGAFANRAVCCGGETLDCCIRESGEPVCINAETQCCLDSECPSDPRFCETGACLRDGQVCDTSFDCGDGGACCPGQEAGQLGVCVDDDQCCNSVECGEFTDFPNCLIGICNLDTHRCEPVSACDLESDCCSENDSGRCVPVSEGDSCDLEEGGSGICCTGECAQTSLCACTRDAECDADLCEECLGGRCRNRCDQLFDTPVCDGVGLCVECKVDVDCFGGFCNTEAHTCFECRSDDDCFECRICDVPTGSCVADPASQGVPCFVPDETGFTCCFGDCLQVCQTCVSDADCSGCEFCELSAGPELAHCQPCFFTADGCCFDDFCLPEHVDCCQVNDDCPPPSCSGDSSSVIRYVCDPVTASGGLCQLVVDEECPGCSSCLDSDTGPSCVEGCQPGDACCIIEQCQPLRTCPASCTDNADCPGECAFCQDNGFCGTLDQCGPTTTTPAPVPCMGDSDCTVEFQVCCDGVCEFNFICNCKECVAARDCSNTPGCCDSVDHCGEPESCQAKSCNQHICVSVTDCRVPLGDERCCPVGLLCNEATGSCEQDMSCDPPCTDEFEVCCDGVCELNFVCNCKECIAAGNCSNTPGCCESLEDCGEPESCQAKSCIEHICSSVSDCRLPLADERCCQIGLICNEEFGFCEQDMSCNPPCTGDFVVCCEGECLENFICNCKECVAGGDCSNTPGCCDTVEHCGEPESCQAKFCNQHICVSVTDCREGEEDECCSSGFVCGSDGSCVDPNARIGTESFSESPCGPCDSYPKSLCNSSTGTCECAPLDSCADGVCGSIEDGCGGMIDCGACLTTPVPEQVTTRAPQVCLAGGDRCVSNDQCCDGHCRGRNCGDRGRKVCQSGCPA